ncbi:Cytochrome p450 [Lasiodiplodia theobromae]|uniref:Uncharacterized protein n=1 Tax=Lasiodiplodia theobromae TaxID=45133 RepID=A0A5N5CY40_9PEZI|nr:Cytochrome p450 [Lasiodiplodia theobromae]KAB2570289.1 hypothetical protein DBV05_g11048 [Lasiodiplodia theobromae]KAF4537789.1 Cytochrome p450 [Lasiodiplodia theobromae]
MATLQDAFVANAAGAPYPDLGPYFSPPENPQQHGICTNQKVHSADYMNFSIFGMAIIFSVGGLIIIASYTIEPFVGWLQKRRRLDSYSRLEWCTNETTQLQRLANEEIGLGVWDRIDETIPVTGRGDLLAVLDLTDPKHPRLRAPPVPYEDEFHVGSLKVAQDSPEPGEADQDKIVREDIQETEETTMETQVRQDSEEDARAQDFQANGPVSHR